MLYGHFDDGREAKKKRHDVCETVWAVRLRVRKPEVPRYHDNPRTFLTAEEILNVSWRASLLTYSATVNLYLLF